MATPRKPRTPRPCACGCGEPIPLTRRPNARYVDDAHRIRKLVRDCRARKRAAEKG